MNQKKLLHIIQVYLQVYQIQLNSYNNNSEQKILSKSEKIIHKTQPSDKRIILPLHAKIYKFSINSFSHLVNFDSFNSAKFIKCSNLYFSKRMKEKEHDKVF